jgi:hypothetical protein
VNDVELSIVDELTPTTSLQGMYDASEMIRVLSKHYPVYRWGIEYDEDGKIVKVFNLTLQNPIASREMYGWVFHLSTVLEDKANGWRKLIMAGGQILERANMERKAWDMYTLPKHIDGVRPKHQPILDANGDPKIL